MGKYDITVEAMRSSKLTDAEQRKGLRAYKAAYEGRARPANPSPAQRTMWREGRQARAETERQRREYASVHGTEKAKKIKSKVIIKWKHLAPGKKKRSATAKKKRATLKRRRTPTVW